MEPDEHLEAAYEDRNGSAADDYEKDGENPFYDEDDEDDG